jgi:hypothetical protein
MEREAKAPLPERLWALRNVAATMALGDASSRKRAVEFQEKALELQRTELGDAPHPGKMVDLWGCAG